MKEKKMIDELIKGKSGSDFQTFVEKDSQGEAPTFAEKYGVVQDLNEVKSERSVWEKSIPLEKLLKELEK